MHGFLLNELSLTVSLRPRTPLLVKAGQDASVLEPVLADMQFVRTRRGSEEQLFIPGSSVRGPLRAHAEKLVRSVTASAACAIVARGVKGGGAVLKPACSPPQQGDPATIYRHSCYTCRLFGNTSLASRVRFSDFLSDPGYPPLVEIRPGVAIDRVTGAVAHGPFELETVADGLFTGTVTLRNFTIGQLGLLGAALLDMAEGLVPLGYGKSRGLGRVELKFGGSLRIFGANLGPLPSNTVAGIRALADRGTRDRYFPGDGEAPGADRLEVAFSFQRAPTGRVASLDHEQVRGLFEAATSQWVAEVKALAS